MLNILSDYPLAFLGFHSAASIHYSVEAMRYAYADRNQYLGDPNFVKVPVTKLLSTTHANNIRQQIKPFKAGDSSRIGFIAPATESTDTTSYAVVDSKGNAVVVTYTINGLFGAGIIAADTGFLLNNEMDDFTIKIGAPNAYGLIQGNANAIQPGKRPLSSMTPTIILKDNKTFMLIGAAGGPTIITQVLATIQNVIDYGMNIQEAIDTPRIHMQWLPDVIFMEKYAISKDTQNLLANMGYNFKLGSPWNTNTWGFSAGILWNPKHQHWTGGVDSRSGSSITKSGY